MGHVTIHCPECGAALTSAEAREPGKLIDCPRCRLLFAPTADDIPATAKRPEPAPVYPRSSPWSARKRRRPKNPNDMLVIVIAGAVMLVLAGLVVGAYVLFVQRPSPSPATPAAPAPAAVAPAAGAAKSDPKPEVEDPNSKPLKPIPRIDDPPVGDPAKKGG